MVSICVGKGHAYRGLSPKQAVVSLNNPVSPTLHDVCRNLLIEIFNWTSCLLLSPAASLSTPHP